MRRFLVIIAIALATATVLTGCHRLGLVPTPKKAATAKSSAATAPAQTFTLSVQNGGGVKGRGAEMVKRLQSLGFKVTSIAINAKKSDHAKTLVVFHPGLEADATKVQKAIGIGALQPATPSLDATTDVMVLVGKDF